MRRWLFSAVLLGALAATGACNFGPHVGENPRPFQSELWKENRGFTTVRCDMVDDLRDRVGLIGRTRAEIETLLGPPHTDSAELSDYDLCPSFMDVWILELHWENDRVTSSTIRDT